ncbi:MAG: Uma2 family endonuclease [Candidatus Omnitrophota bacterium]
MGVSVLQIEDLPHYMYKDYVQWEGRWELIQGIPFAMVTTPAINHQRTVRNIETQLVNLLTDCPKCEVLASVEWAIFDDTVVQPDVLVVCGDRDKIGDRKLEINPIIVFEVLSPSTSRKDKIIKYRLYEQAGLKYYCIVNFDTKSADLFCLNQDQTQYRKEDSIDGKITFNLDPCSLSFDFEKVFII